MKIIEHKTLVKNDDYNSFPSIVRASNGNLLAVFRQADNSLKKYGKVTHVDPSSHVSMIVSEDDGLHWSNARIIHNDDLGSQDPCLNCFDDGMLICSFFQWKVVPLDRKEELGEAFEYHGRTVFDRWAALNIGTACIRSFDNGKTWDGPWSMEPSGLDGATALSGNIIELPSKRLLAPVYASKCFGELTRCFILSSDDRGQSWKLYGEVPGDPNLYFLEPFLYNHPSPGRFDILMRTQRDFRKYDFDDTYLPLHVASSHDNGITWSQPKATKLFCPNPIHALNISDNRLLLSYGQRREPMGIEAFLSDSNQLDLDSPKIEMIRSSESGDLGYTSAVVLNDGSVLIVYYMTDADESAFIGATRVEV